jgi:hypothetical protein
VLRRCLSGNIGYAGAAFVLNVLFVRMERNEIEGWQGEDALGVESAVKSA